VLVFANPVNSEIRKSTGLDTDPQLNREASILRSLNFVSSPLPFAQVEAKKIREINPAARVITRSEATENRLKDTIKDFDILHLASHAYIDTMHDALSGIHLTFDRDSENDGILMGYEISELELNCDMAVLSACETGRGKIVEGEGCLSLPRLFLGMGVNTVIMTLWKVDDQFTSNMMPDFYLNYFDGKLSAAAALANAKRSIITGKYSKNGIFYQHPFFWAAFTLYGDPGAQRFNFSLYIIPLFILILALITGLVYRYKIRSR
jgi:CHAT domain-containing protein